jgi:hypothetical protein
MLVKLLRIFFVAAIIFFTVMFVQRCKPNAEDAAISASDAKLKINRFDLALTDTTEPAEVRFARLKKQYGNFFNRFTNDIIRINNGDSIALLNEFKRFLADPDFNEVSHAVKDTFKDISGMEKIMGSSLARYKYYFPEKNIPQVITFVSLFNYAIICTDTVLGIGLDMYLGSTSKYYTALGFPVYKIKKMQREYIPVDAMRGWVESEFESQTGKQDFLTEIIHQGKILYLLKKLMPEENDTLLTGYSASQLKWCYENEKNIWSFFVENQLLFSTSMELYSKYSSEGPTTSGFPPESPGNIAAFTGWQIVNDYMKENPDISLAALMKQNDAATILKDSKYKPKK